MPTAPLVSVLVAVHNGEPYVHAAFESVLRQSVADFELLAIDDCSTDGTSDTLASMSDSRVRVLRNEERLGLAGSLNRGLDEARGRYVARMDADDAAFPDWLARCLALLRSRGDVGVVGAGVLDIDVVGRPGPVHLLESGSATFRWRALFSSPAFHNTVVIERELLERNGLRYDVALGESEDYDLWARFLQVTEGDSVEAPLVLHRLHPEQATRVRGELQRSLAQDVSLRQIEELAPGLSGRGAELARLVGLAASVATTDAASAADAYVELLDRFTAAKDYPQDERQVVCRMAARSLARLALRSGGTTGMRIFRRAAVLDPAVLVHVAARRAHRHSLTRAAYVRAIGLLDSLASGSQAPPMRVAAVFPEPTPYRAPLLDRVAALPEIDLTVIYAADTVARRTWQVEPKHRAVFLHGLRIPGARKVVHHDYPLTPGVVGALTEARPAVVVVSGWSTFAAQAAIAWCRLKRVPYLLVVESHDEGPRAGWRRSVKGTVVPPLVQNASGVLVTGTLARNSMLSRGAAPERVRVFANTIDVEGFGRRADELAARRPELRRELGADLDALVVLSVARLVQEKGFDTLIRAVAAADDRRIVLVLVGDGPERDRLEQLAAELGARAVFAGDMAWEKIVEVYVAADVFALLSVREPWGVVVNEAAACGLPLILSDRVGAAHDLLRDGENGALVSAGDVGAAATALRALAADPTLRRAQGARSRELARDWGYGPSVEAFLAAVREAVADQG